jgi:hypothetical protein
MKLYTVPCRTYSRKVGLNLYTLYYWFVVTLDLYLARDITFLLQLIVKLLLLSADFELHTMYNVQFW